MEEPESALTPTPAPRVRETAVTAATARDREPGPAPESLTHPDPGGLAGDERAGERGDPPCGTPDSLHRRHTSLGGPPLLARPIPAAGVTAIRFWVAAIRLPEGGPGPCGRLPRRCGAPIRRSCGIQPVVVPSWRPGVPVAALVSWAVRWSLQRPHGRPAFGSGQRIIAMTSAPMVPDRSSSARRHGLWPVGSPPVRPVADNEMACGPSVRCSA
jgi:hypothetical protein